LQRKYASAVDEVKQDQQDLEGELLDDICSGLKVVCKVQIASRLKKSQQEEIDHSCRAVIEESNKGF